MIVIDDIGKLYTAKEIADLLEISEMTVMRNYRTGKLNGRKFGKKVLFLDSCLQEFLTGKDREIKPVKKRAKKTEQVKTAPKVEQEPKPVEPESFDLFKQVEPVSNSNLVEIKADPKPEPIPPGQILKTDTKAIHIRKINNAMEQAGNNREKASQILGMKRSNFQGWLKKYNLNFPKSNRKLSK
jgi:excisionase family DNA binding protein